MNTPTPTSTPPGDREAAQNATRRAERRGTAAAQVDAAAVRLALAGAISMNHFKQLLEVEGIEAEFDRRGQAQAVYGWRLRRQGSEEWLKASTLARDLSWPKIAHRFSADVDAEAVDQEVKTTVEARHEECLADDRAQVMEDGREQDRRPAMVRSILQPRPKLDLNLPKTTNNIARADIGPISKVMLMVGMAAIKLSVAAIQALLNFLGFLLAKFSIGMGPATPGSQAAQSALPFEPRFLDVESRILPVPQTAIENAAAQLLQVADAIEKCDPDLLPAGQGRAELAAALVAETSPFSISPSPAAAETVAIKQGGLNELFSVPEVATLPAPDQLVGEALADFKRAVEEQESAESRCNNATKIVADEVLEARRKLVAAEQKLSLRENDHWAEEAEMPRLLKFAFPSVKAFCATEIASVDTAKAALAAAEKAHPARVPEALNVALLQARIGSVRAAEIAANQQKTFLETLKDGDVELYKAAKSRVHFFVSQVGILGNHPSTFHAQNSLKAGLDAIDSIAEKRIELEAEARREVQKELEASSQKHVPRNEYVDDAPGQ